MINNDLIVEAFNDIIHEYPLRERKNFYSIWNELDRNEKIKTILLHDADFDLNYIFDELDDIICEPTMASNIRELSEMVYDNTNEYENVFDTDLEEIYSIDEMQNFLEKEERVIINYSDSLDTYFFYKNLD